MRRYLSEHPWKIIEEGFHPEQHRSSESLFSLGNGHMGQRANFEETYSGESLQGNYIAGIYYPDKTRVGWWKIGYPEYFAKVLNAPSWIGLKITLNNQVLDLNILNIRSFNRTLDMREGVLHRSFEVEFGGGEIVEVSTERFLSIARQELGGINYSLKLLRGSGDCIVEFYLDGDIRNEDANYDEKFWEPIGAQIEGSFGGLTSKTKKTGFVVSTGMSTKILINNKPSDANISEVIKKDRVSLSYNINLEESDLLSIEKLAAIFTSRDHPVDKINGLAFDMCKKAKSLGYNKLKKEHVKAWEEKWKTSDIVIEGDVLAQQGIRFSIFQLNQTYTGHDPRLNIGPKGFTGEKYGGSTYWDTEAYCLPFYLKTANPEIAKNLLIYRYKHLEKAIQNAKKLGIANGAALFPMVTMNGEECHNEWEITFEEIHRNGAVVYAIYNYIRHTGDIQYLDDYGLEVIISIARYWVQRAHFSSEKQKFVIHGVTGPNEYENNVNNNWYTNYIAAWCLGYAAENIDLLKDRNPERYIVLSDKLNIKLPEEADNWIKVSNEMYLPEEEKLGIYLQQDGYMDKEQLRADQIPENDRPINQNWSWDRILRSCFIKQADVLQGLYFFEDHFDMDTLRRNFEFYESRTVHESSLSPSIHVILACKLGMKDKAFELYHRTARLDLDDYNNEVHEGCHITSMAGSWLAVVEGFGGMRIANNHLHFNPLLPDSWDSLEFTVRFSNRMIKLSISRDTSTLKLLDGKPITIYLNGEKVALE